MPYILKLSRHEAQALEALLSTVQLSSTQEALLTPPLERLRELFRSENIERTIHTSLKEYADNAMRPMQENSMQVSSSEHYEDNAKRHKAMDGQTPSTHSDPSYPLPGAEPAYPCPNKRDHGLMNMVARKIHIYDDGTRRETQSCSKCTATMSYPIMSTTPTPKPNTK